ncbi:MAG TPA: 50S ribosomal protein L10 [bacterium]|nr:50S ribosomal protein L10 [bacterium]
MTRPSPEKVAEVEALEKRLRKASVVILTDYRGLTVSELNTLRSRLREASLEYRVTKNTLLNRAAERVGVTGLSPLLSGPTAVVFGTDDPGVPARLLQEFIRQYRKLEIKGGVVQGEALGADIVQALATLPTRTELLARVVGALQGPLRGVVSALSAPPRALVMTLDALRKQREAEPAGAAGGTGETGDGTADVAGAASVPGEGQPDPPAGGSLNGPGA